MGFDEKIIDMVYRLVSNNWYSVLLNGQATSFIKSTRGVKQGDPLSPTLFIRATEVLGRALHALYDNPNFIGYGMPKWSQNINYLSYADDTIIFSSLHYGAIQLIMNVLEEYEKASGEKVNKGKSSFYMHEKETYHEANTVHLITEFQRHPFPFTYLGCPIFYSRRKKEFYKDIIFKVQAKLHSWNGKLLSIGGREILIAHVLESLPIHLLSAVNLPKHVITELHKMFARFYWSNSGNGKARQWASWDTLCLLKEEGGVGFRSLRDISKALFGKLWWNFRTKKILWTTFMRNKYCKKIHKYNNWAGVGSLYHASGPDHWCDESVKNIHELIENGQWNVDMLRDVLPDELFEHIIETIQPPTFSNIQYKPWWQRESKGKLTVKSARQYVRKRKQENKLYKFIRVKGVSFKVSFFMWRLWKAKLLLDDTFRRWGYVVTSRCWCCRSTTKETLAHVFFRSLLARFIWKYFSLAIGKIKCNTDGACRGNGRASYAFFIRDGIGDLLYAQAEEIHDATNNVAELPPCVIETDSLLMKRVLDEVWEPRWHIVGQVEEILNLMSSCVVAVTHMLREGNKLVDHLANLTLELNAHIQAESFGYLDTHGKKILNSDKMQVPYIRVQRRRLFYMYWQNLLG
ncbi:uncharacterized protein [Nicotiana tomentosiformis]|uniref:uncharacterized protein n=1 Tax=Nicotiana tomentosiformis TaxID=4098 RepID=UPI00388CE98E